MIAQSEEKITILGYLMTQYSLKAGMRKFVAWAEDAAVTELTQLEARRSYEALKDRKSECFIITYVLQGEMRREAEKSTLCQWSIAKRVHPKGRSSFSHCSD